MSVAEPAAPATTELDVTGMTCASCAARIERRLNRIEGVTATVNYATGRAAVTSVGVTPEEVLGTIRRLGYGAAAVERAPLSSAAPRAAEDGTPDEAAELRQRFLVCLALSLPVIALTMIPEWQFRYWQWVALALSWPVVVWGGWRFHRAAAMNARHLTATMDTLVSLGTLAAFGWSLYALFWGDAGLGGSSHYYELIPRLDRTGSARLIYLEVAAGVITALLAGRWIELRGRRRAGAALAALRNLRAETAELLVGGRGRRVPAQQLVPGDEVRVGPGETVPADGTVIGGGTALDTSAMTGEPMPREVGTGDSVEAGTVSTSGTITVRVRAVGEDTRWARTVRLVERAQESKAAAQRLADRISSAFVPTVLALTAVTILFWVAVGARTAFALSAGLAVLIIACPCALGLATPTALLVGTARGARLGILIRGPEVLERVRAVDTVVVDKTGTLTEGRMAVTGVTTGEGIDRAEVLRRAGALEAESGHPVARAVLTAADPDGDAELPPVSDRAEVPGLGVTGIVEDRSVIVGRPALLTRGGVGMPEELGAAVSAAEEAGSTVVAVAEDGVAVAVLAIGDAVRSSAELAVEELRSRGIRVLMLTGDHPGAATRVAASVGIPEEDVIAGVLPDQKEAEVRRLQDEGDTVAMVGDGVNDAAALARADIGLALGSGSAAAMAAGDITLTGTDLRAVPDALRLSRRILGTIRGNLFWAFTYNVVALPVAALGLLSPMIAGGAMALSSAFVVGNSLRLRRFRARRR